MTTSIKLIQDNVPISQSLIWKHWSDSYKLATFEDLLEIPHGITSAQCYADSMAEFSLAFIRNGLSNGDINPEFTVFILETGSGTAVYALRFIKHLKSLLELTGLSHIKFCYIVTDGSTVVVNALAENQDFQEFIQTGEVDFGLLQLDNFFSMPLRYSGFIFGETPLRNPLIVTSNYFFDSLPYDVFEIRDHQLFEMRESLYTEEDNYADGKVIDISKMVASHDGHQISLPHYNHHILDELLEQYAKEYKNITFALSKTSIEIIEKLREYSHGRMLQLIGDLGNLWTKLGPSSSNPYPKMKKVSWASVNFDSFEQLAKYNNDYSTAIRNTNFDLETNFEQLFIFHGLDYNKYPDLKYQILRMQNTQSYNINRLRTWFNINYEKIEADQFLWILELARGDVINMSDTLMRLQKFVREDSGFKSRVNRERVMRIIENIYQNTPGYYAKANWIQFMIGNIANSLNEYKASLKYLDKCTPDSLSEYNKWVLYYNRGNAFMHLSDFDLAMDAFNKALKEKPGDTDTIRSIVTTSRCQVPDDN